MEILPTLVCETVEDVRDKIVMNRAMKAAIMSKQFGNDGFLTPLIVDACGKLFFFKCSVNDSYGCHLTRISNILQVSILPGKTTFNVDNIRVCKILVFQIES